MAATQGEPRALNSLGAMYQDGIGFTINKVIAYALFNLSTNNESNADYAKINRSRIAEKMSVKEIEEGQALAREMSKPGNLLIAMDQYMKNSRR